MTNVDRQARIRLASEGVVASYIHELARAGGHRAPERGGEGAAADPHPAADRLEPVPDRVPVIAPPAADVLAAA